MLALELKVFLRLSSKYAGYEPFAEIAAPVIFILALWIYLG